MFQSYETGTKVELAPNQVYITIPKISNRVQTLVEGSTEWSYYQWQYTGSVSLYYQGHLFHVFQPDETDYVYAQEPHPRWTTLPSVHYTTLAEVVEVFKQDIATLARIEQWNKEDGLEEWCERQPFTLYHLAMNLELPPNVSQRIERLAKFERDTLEEFVLQALYKHLATVEDQYLRAERWKQSKFAASSEHVELDQSHNS